MVYQHKWSPISYRSSAGQQKQAAKGRRPTAGPRNDEEEYLKCSDALRLGNEASVAHSTCRFSVQVGGKNVIPR